MKNLAKLMILAGATIPAAASAQLTLTASAASPQFTALINSMHSHAMPALDDIPAGKVTFNPTSGWTTNVATFTSDISGETKYFETIGNAETIQFVTDFQIGFFGNESIDQNALDFFASLVSDPSDTDSLITPEGDWNFLYQGQIGNNPAKSVNVGWTPSNEAIAGIFFHRDISQGIDGDQSQPAKFRIYQEYVESVPGNEDFVATGGFLFAIDDRMGQDDDWDDGLFYLFSEGATPVPEPAAIAGMAVLGMGIMLVIRRRLRQSK